MRIFAYSSIIYVLFASLINLALGFRVSRFLTSRKTQHLLMSSSLPVPIPMTFGTAGGKVVVSGIGEVDEDEFFLNLLNEQNVWDPVILAGTDDAAMKKRFLSRSARYSGLLNILNIVNADIAVPEQLSKVLDGASTWVAYNVARENIVPFSKAAIASNIKRAIFTTGLARANINDTRLPEFTEAIQLFQAAGGSFTGIRHGQIITGDENFPYEIVNATIPCLEPVVERGVLERVVAELLQIENASNIECGISSSSAFAGAYLNVLRSSGLTRREEVERVLAGGIQRVARLTVKQYEDEKAKLEEQAARAERRKIELAEAEAKERRRLAKFAEEQAELEKKTQEIDESEFLITESKDQMINRRMDEILRFVWNEYDARMITKTTSKYEFYESNKEKARALATTEVEDLFRKKEEEREEAMARKEVMTNLIDVNRKQYAKLLSLEKKELAAQKQISDTWVKYVYLLLEYTMEHCQEKNILFYNLDEFGQTMLLRSTANELRKMVDISDYEIVYDPMDATAIVEKLSPRDIGKKYGIDQPIDDIVKALTKKYGSVLKSVSALRGAQQIVETAIETLQREIPPVPPTVNEARRAESLEKQQNLSKSKLETMRNRGQPSADIEGESVVGRL